METKILNNQTSLYEKRFIDLITYCFQMCKEEEVKRDWDRVNSKSGESIILGALEGEVLASTVTLSKRMIFIDEKEVVMYGVGGVATDSIYRSGGVCKNLLKEALKKMYQEGAVFSMLAPFSYGFYEKLGWKWCYTSHYNEFEVERLKSFKNLGYLEKINDMNFEILNKYYHQSIQTLNGMTTRKEADWEKRLKGEDKIYTVLYKGDAGAVEGYMIYTIDHNQLIFNVKEIQYSSLHAIKSLLYYIYTHSAQVNKVSILALDNTYILDLLDNPRCESKQLAYMMGRIINLEKALMAYEYTQDGKFLIKVEDDTLEENNGIFKVEIREKQAIQVMKVDNNECYDLAIDIRELTQLIIGFRTLTELEKIEKVRVSSLDIKTYFKEKRSNVGLYDFF